MEGSVTEWKKIHRATDARATSISSVTGKRPEDLLRMTVTSHPWVMSWAPMGLGAPSGPSYSVAPLGSAPSLL